MVTALAQRCDAFAVSAMLTWQQSEDGGMVDVRLANPTPYGS